MPVSVCSPPGFGVHRKSLHQPANTPSQRLDHACVDHISVLVNVAFPRTKSARLHGAYCGVCRVGFSGRRAARVEQRGCPMARGVGSTAAILSPLLNIKEGVGEVEQRR